jgi:hypothetical protein
VGLGGHVAEPLLDRLADPLAEEAEVGRLAGGDVGAAGDRPAGKDILQ